MSHLLVTNDFPPKVGGIQSYLWELWRRLPPERVTVLTTAYRGSVDFDLEQPYRVLRAGRTVLLPTPALVRWVRALAHESGAGVVVLDPALPLGLIGPRLGLPYAVVLHGAEVTVPARLPGSRRALTKVLGGACHLVAASGYAEEEARRVLGDAMPPVTAVPPGVDVERFRPLGTDGRAKARADLGLPADGPLVVGVSRLVPRKGMDTLVEASALLRPLHPDLVVAIAGQGRDRRRLERLAARHRAPVRFLGAVADDQLAAVYGCGDVFAMPCRRRWGGLDQEGFGIVFLEAAACGVPQVAGDSGGAREAVWDGETGLVVRRPDRAADVASALSRLLADHETREAMGRAARRRAAASFSYDALALRLDRLLQDLES